MHILTIEPTPNPNTMKLIMDERLPDGISLNFTPAEQAKAPDYIRRLLAIPGVKGIYQVSDFIALDRQPRADWRAILAQARAVLSAGTAPGGAPATEASGNGAGTATAPSLSGLQVFVQKFRGIPMQIKLVSGTGETRLALPERFKQAVAEAAGEANVVLERRWEDLGIRYGSPEEVGQEVAQELSAAYDDERLHNLVVRAQQQQAGEPPERDLLPPAAVAERLRHPDWKVRYGALERLDPSEDALPVIVRALGDANASVRRLATAYLGEVGAPAALPHLIAALKDPAPAVRRAAGDVLSDLGDPAAMEAMAGALKDPSRLVRWRAARYLYEVGDASALPALRAAQDDPEFEVSLQVRMATERIEEGRAAAEPAWKQMTKGISDN